MPFPASPSSHAAAYAGRATIPPWFLPVSSLEAWRVGDRFLACGAALGIGSRMIREVKVV